jgi:hypothetical protein
LHGGDEICIKIFIGKAEGKKILRKWWNNILEWILETEIGKVRTGFIWLRTGISGRLL